jgi:hypothetical protein
VRAIANPGHLLMDCPGRYPYLRDAVTLFCDWNGSPHAQLLKSVRTGLRRPRCIVRELA